MSDIRRPIWVEWVDSSSRHGWHDLKEAFIPTMVCQTLGWLVQERDDAITIALSGVFDGSSSAPYAHLLCIPKVAIISRRDVELSHSATSTGTPKT